MSLRRRVIAVALVVPLGLAATVVPFFRPTQDGIHRADAVVVPSGDHGERIARAKQLMDGGVARTLVFVGLLDNLGEDKLCAGALTTYEVRCLSPEPDNTRTEARAVGQLAKSRSWTRVIVVTSTYHVSRARLLFRRCVSGAVDVVGQRPPYGRRDALAQVRHEWLGFVYALTLARGC